MQRYAEKIRKFNSFKYKFKSYRCKLQQKISVSEIARKMDEMVIYCEPVYIHRK